MSDSKPGSDLPRMVPDRDQIRSRKSTASTSTTPRNAPSPSRSEPPGGGSRIPMVIWVLIAVLAVATGGLGVMAYSQQQSLAMFDERLQLADDRIVTMQRSMTETDESVVMNETAINNQFRAIKAETDMQMSEIRKLWDVSNKRNREWIETNQQNIAQLQSTLQSQTQAIETVTGRTAEQAQSTEAVRQQVASVQAQISETAGQFAALQDSLNNLDPATLEERLLSLTLTQENLLVEQGTVSMNQQLLEEEVAELNDVLRSIDAGRLEANRRLVAVSDRVQALENRLLPGSGAQ